jgi:glycine/D-amino acid oxidase-like deaminating enzyme
LIPQNLALCDQKVGLDYYRLSADRRLLFGGACHYSGRDPADIAAYMRPKMLKVFPQLADVRIDYQWGGKIGITANRFPQVGRLKQQPNVFYAQGYSGHGLNVTHWCARLLGEAIHAGHSQGMDVFSAVPHMTFPGGPACAHRCWHWACCGIACAKSSANARPCRRCRRLRSFDL